MLLVKAAESQKYFYFRTTKVDCVKERVLFGFLQ